MHSGSCEAELLPSLGPAEIGAGNTQPTETRGDPHNSPEERQAQKKSGTCSIAKKGTVPDGQASSQETDFRVSILRDAVAGH